MLTLQHQTLVRNLTYHQILIDVLFDVLELFDDNQLLLNPDSSGKYGSTYTENPSPPPLLQPLQEKTANLEETPIPPPPFSTPPKLIPVDRILKEYPGKGELQLRSLATVLARDSILGRKVLGKCFLGERKSTDTLDPNYLITVIWLRQEFLYELLVTGIRDA